MAKVKEEDQWEDLTSENQEISDFDDLSDTDYVFIVNKEGQLKNVIFPPVVGFEYSKDLLSLFLLFGIKDPDEFLIPEEKNLH